MSEVRAGLRQIGGPSAVSWPAFIVSWVLSIFAYLGGSSAPLGSVALWFTLLTVAQVLAFAPLAVVHARLRSSLEVRPRPVLMLTLFALVSVIRGVVLDTGLRVSGAEAEPQLIFRVFAAMPTIVVALSTMAIIVGTAREHRAQLAELVRVNLALEQARERTEQAVSQEQSRALERITVTLQEELAGLDPDRPAESAEALHHLAADVVRPLSHELANAVPTWQPSPPPVPPPRVSPWRVIAQLPAGRPFMPVLTAAAVAGSAFGTTVNLLGLAAATARLAFGFVVVAGLLVAINLAMASIPTRWPNWVRAAVFIAASVVTGFAAAVVAALILPAGPAADRLIPSAFRYGIVMALLFAGVKAFAAVQRDVLLALERQGQQLRWSAARARQVQWFQQRMLSRALHGPAQSALSAAAMRLDAARQEQRPLAPIIEETRTELLGVLGDVGHGRDASLKATIEQLTSMWSRICAIDIDVDSATPTAMEVDAVARTIVADIITECVSNAIRHGGAGRIRVQVQCIDNLVHVSVWDDGAPPEAMGRRGLGSQLLDECAVQWRREAVGGGTQLTADLPLVVEVTSASS